MKKLIFLFILLAAVACNPYDIDEILISREDISLTVKGVTQFSYNPLTCQISQNARNNEYRVFDDMMSEWFTVKCNEMPVSEGQEVIVDIAWTASKSTRSMNNLEFTVEKTDAEGKIWMWCEKKSIGIVIKNL